MLRAIVQLCCVDVQLHVTALARNAQWLIIYLLGVVAFGTGISVLYRNQVMNSGFLYRPYNEFGFSGEECTKFDLASQ
jgi:hypothetical protein